MTTYNLICLMAVLDDHREGFENAHPDYVAEKFSYFGNAEPQEAYSMLDHRNQSRVDMWCANWNLKNKGKQ